MREISNKPRHDEFSKVFRGVGRIEGLEKKGLARIEGGLYACASDAYVYLEKHSKGSII